MSKHTLPSLESTEASDNQPAASNNDVAVVEPLDAKVQRYSELHTVIADEYEGRLEVADSLLREIVTNDRQPHYAENIFFQGLGWTEQDIAQQRARMRSVVRLEAVAGSQSDRDASRDAAALAVNLLGTEGDKLKEQIAKLQGAIRQLELDAARSTRRVEEQNQAIAELAKHAPIHVVAKANHIKQAYRATIFLERHRVEDRLRQLASVCNAKNYEQRSHHQSALADAFPAYSVAPERRGENGGPESWYGHEVWSKIQREMKREVMELEPKLAQLQQECEAREAEIKSILNCYVQ